MDQFLTGLLRDLERRCAALSDRFAEAKTEDIQEYALHAYRQVETLRRQVVQALNDPALHEPALRPNYLQRYNQWSQHASAIESYLLPFVERFAAPDRLLTGLCRQLTAEIGWPLRSPLVATFSYQYYWTVADFNLICVPAAENVTLLGLPDLCHELGHILMFHHRAALIGSFMRDLTRYIKKEQRRVVTQQRSPEYRALYDLLFVQWSDEWLLEFVSDMVATYLVGPAFGWQHIRLCASLNKDVYFPALGERASHPADEARLRGVLAVLAEVEPGRGDGELLEMWQQFVQCSGKSQPPDYAVCYPPDLISALARVVVQGCAALGLRGFASSGHRPGTIICLLMEAWSRFLEDPETCIQWEAEQLKHLWRELELASS